MSRETPRKVIAYLDHTAALSGGEIALLELVQKIDKTRYEPVVVLFSEGPLQEKLVESGIETHVLPLSSEVVQTRKDTLKGNSLARIGVAWRALAYTWRLSRFLKTRRADVVHTNSLKADILGGMAARLARVPLLWHVRDRIEPDYLPAPAVRVFRWLCRWMPNLVVANSRATLETLHLPPSKPADVIYSGVNLADGSYDAKPSETNANAPLIGIIGRITPWKGQHIFLQAAAQVRQQFPNARFQIIGAALFGEEEYEAEMRALATSLDLEDCVEFLGFRKDIPALLQKLTLLVHASTMGEPFGQVVAQGMAASRPVVATDGGGIPEMILPGQTGLLVPMGNADRMAEAIEQLLSNPEEAQRMGRAARQRIEEAFTIEHSARKAESLYARLA